MRFLLNILIDDRILLLLGLTMAVPVGVLFLEWLL